ncbi:MAG: InlB B-repeat-containing protein, partial [Tannerella sp.]|nr:InlB B-repeat-containing protein [Tannerella sp.]
MKKITFLMLCCIFTLFIPSEVWAQSAQTVNESGGAGLNDGLKFVVNTNGAIAVYRDNRTQYYNGYDWGDVGNRGRGVTLTFRFSQGSNYSTSTAPLQVCSTTPVVKTGNTYKTSISGYVNSTLSNDRFYVTLDVTYTHPNRYFMVDYIVRSPRTLTAAGQTVHMYLDHDAMILGCDASFGYISNNSTGHFVGDYRDNCPTCPGPGNLTGIGKYVKSSSHGFKTNGVFRSHYTGRYDVRTDVNGTLQLSNTYTTSMTDDGIAVEFTAGPFTQANQTFVRSVAHCYGNNKTEFDNLAINVPAAPAISTPVTLEFISADFSETEGNHTAQNVKIKVSGGILGSDQVCSFTMSGGTAGQNTDYTYVKGFTIPAGDYSTPRELALNNITIKDNAVCNDSKWTNIAFEVVGDCNDMLQIGDRSSAKITIRDNEPRPEITTSLRDTVYNTGENVSSLNLTSDIAGSTITWTNSNTAIGLPASGTGNIPSFTATNTTAGPITATITVKATKECAGIAKTFTITVNSKFNITYDYNGGVAPSTANPTEFLVASLPMNIVNTPTRTGYTFAGWTCAALG